MIDLSTETIVSLADATTHLPTRRGRRPVHVATLYRWAQRGLKGIRLEIIQIGGTSCTSLEALQRFFDRLTAARSGDLITPRTSRQRERAAAAADAELSREGW